MPAATSLPRLERSREASASSREFEYGPEDFRALARLLEERTGIHLPPHKDQLLYSRLSKRLRALGMASFRAYRTLLASPAGSDEIGRMVNALTTNLTQFFREPHHFDHLRTSLARLKDGGSRRVRLWSAGCSTGQEAYCMALTLAVAIPDFERWDARILATDIDTDVLAVARAGLYPKDETLDEPTYRRFVREMPNGEVEIDPSLRALVTFNPLNLIGAWPFKGPFDAIFCRNVAIYFSEETQTAVFSRMLRMLSRTGHLYIGHSETLDSKAGVFELVAQTTYRAHR